MTKCNPESPTIRLTDAEFHGKKIIVEIHPRYTTFRLQGSRTQKYNLAHDIAFERAMKNYMGVEAPPRTGKRVSRGVLNVNK